jgi:hypothetical protein
LHESEWEIAMKPRSRSILIFIVVVLILLTREIATAQTTSYEPVVRPLKITEPVNRRYGNFNVDFEYYERDAFLGNNLEVKVTVTSISNRSLKFVGFEEDDTSRSILARIDKLNENLLAGDLLRAEYRYILGIKAEAIPQIYNIKLRFEPYERDKHPKDEQYADIIKTFPLNVGVRDGGLLRMGSEDGSEPILCTMGNQQDFYLPLINRFPRYAVNIERMEVITKPDGLIKRIVSTNPGGEINGNAVSFDPSISIDSAQRQLLTLRLEMASMSFTRFADNFFDDPHKVELAFVYNDGHGRRISDYIHSVEIKVKPSGSLWLLSMLLGVMLGTTVSLSRKPGEITKSLITVRVIIGVIASFLVWVGHIQIFVWNLRGSYDNPLIIFLIGFAASYVGQALLDVVLTRQKQVPSIPAVPIRQSD